MWPLLVLNLDATPDFNSTPIGFIDPNQCVVLPSMQTPISLVTGSSFLLAIRCILRGRGTTHAVFAATDIITAAIYASGQLQPTLVPTSGFFTNGDVQSGYTQGEISLSITSTQAQSLINGVTYTILVWRATASDPTNPEMVARIQLAIEPLAFA